MSEWQPIETAPKDGDEGCLLLYNDSIGIFTGYWCPIVDDWSVGPSHGGDFEWPGEQDPIERDGQPTHWMPLPEPPK